MKILVCTLVINDWYYDVVRYSIKNLTSYCNKHNYELYLDDGKGLDTVYDGKRDIQWYKILMIKKLMLEKDFDYLFWYDIDSQINNHDIKLEYFIDKYLVNNSDTELVATQDRTTLNTGMMFIKKSEYIISLMDKIWNNVPYNKSGVCAFIKFAKTHNVNVILENNRGTLTEYSNFIKKINY